MTTPKTQTSSKAKPARRPITRRRLKQYTAHTYGARLPYADARFMDNFCEQNRMERADAVRLAVKQFVARQGLAFKRLDPAREMHEQVLREQLAPVLEQLQALARAAEDAGNEAPTGAVSPAAHPDESLLERTLATASLALRILVNYALEPTMRSLEAGNADEIQAHLRAAAGGPDHWCESTRQVFGLTERQIFRELNIEPPEASHDAQRSAPKAPSGGIRNGLFDSEVETFFGHSHGGKRA